MRQTLVYEAKELTGGEFRPGAIGENNKFDCFGLVIVSLYRTLGYDKKDHPAYLRWPRQVMRLFTATPSVPVPADLLFVPNNDETFHTLIYVGHNRFVHSTSKVDDSGEQLGVVEQELPQFMDGSYITLGFDRLARYLIDHHEGRNVNAIE